jgi:hypothetical protein
LETEWRLETIIGGLEETPNIGSFEGNLGDGIRGRRSGTGCLKKGVMELSRCFMGGRIKGLVLEDWEG